MRFIKMVFLFALSVTMLASCDKEESSGATKTFLKYEIFSSAPLSDTANTGKISYTDSTGSQQLDSNFINGTNSWTRTIDITTVEKPFSVSLSTIGRFYVTHNGTVESRIYINGVLSSTISGSITSSGNENYISLPALNYVIQ